MHTLAISESQNFLAQVSLLRMDEQEELVIMEEETGHDADNELTILVHKDQNGSKKDSHLTANNAEYHMLNHFNSTNESEENQ